MVEENKIKTVEFLGIFAGIIAFILSGIGIIRDHNLFDSLVLMLALALSLILFVLAIDVIAINRFSYTDKNVRQNITRIKFVILAVVILIFIFILYFAYMLDHPDIVNQMRNVTQIYNSTLD